MNCGKDFLVSHSLCLLDSIFIWKFNIFYIFTALPVEAHHSKACMFDFLEITRIENIVSIINMQNIFE